MKRLFALIFVLLLICGCGKNDSVVSQAIAGQQPEKTMPLEYATQFSIEYYADGFKLITLSDGSRFMVIPEGKSCPKGMAKDIIPLFQPIDDLYIAATASICHFDALNRLDVVSLSGTKESGWYIPNMKTAMQKGEIAYAGKYSEPDYELLLKHNCPLAVESLMIGHASEVKAKLNEIGIAVLTDLSSLEPHPLGRTEWIKLYAALLNEEQKAQKLFSEQRTHLNNAISEKKDEKTVVFFHISSSGYVVARKSGDYVTKMLQLAGGKYLFDDLGDPETRTSTVNLEMEKFFATAKDADIIIYNSTIGGEVKNIEQLIGKNPLLAEFKAVKSNDVWCTTKNMYQDTTHIGEMTESFAKIFSDEADTLDELPYLYRLK